MASTTDTLKSLNSARDIVLRDHTLYPQVVPGVLQVIAPGAQVELRRWGADFLAETFASQVVTAQEKQKMSIVVLDTLKGYLDRKETVGQDEDISVVKSAVQCAASIYPYVFRHIVSNTTDNETWSKMAAVKASILQCMDTASPGVRMCCIKFVSCVVQTQTPGMIADPRRPEQNEISLALVSRDHPIIPPTNLEAEASGLLDRLLGVFQDGLNDALIITATINSLSTLVQRRPGISSKIMTAILSYNPFKQVHRPMSTADKVSVKSMTRTTTSFLLNFLKRNQNSSFAIRIPPQVERLRQGLTDVLSDSHQQQLKRPAPDGPTDGLEEAKRQRLDEAITNGAVPQQQPHRSTYPPLPAGPLSLAQVWTLTTNPQATTFDASKLPLQAVTQLVPALIQSLDQNRIDEVINVVRARWLELGSRSTALAADNARAVAGDDEEDDDYDPSLTFGGDSDQAVNQLDLVPPDIATDDIAIGPFSLPPPPPLTDVERIEYGKVSLTRVLGTLAELDRESKSGGKPQETEKGFNRLAAAVGHDRDGWITLLTRLATRSAFDLEGGEAAFKDDKAQQSVYKRGRAFELGSGIREALLNYVMENFRARIEVAIMWLNEEWYSDRLLQKQRQDCGLEVDLGQLPNYWHWTVRLLDAMIPYFDVKDGKLLIRFLSEVPAINRDVLQRAKNIAMDPERVQISVNALLYLIMFRPPIRNLAIDCAEEMWKENSDAKSAAKKILTKWRPEVLAQENSTTEVKVAV